jgi:hypothetical protein
MVKEATDRQTLISLVKRKIHKVYIKYVQDKSQRGDDELMENFLEELKEFNIHVDKKTEEHKFYNMIVGFSTQKHMEEFQALLKKYNKLF